MDREGLYDDIDSDDGSGDEAGSASDSDAEFDNMARRPESYPPRDATPPVARSLTMVHTVYDEHQKPATAYDTPAKDRHADEEKAGEELNTNPSTCAIQ